MKDLFPGYYSPTEDEYQKLWRTGIFIFDTNFLLDLFRYSDLTSEYLITIIQTLSERIWIPYQVSKEYHKNLNTTISGQVRKYEDTLNTLTLFKKQIDEKRSHPFLSEQLHSEIGEFCKKVDHELKSKKDDVKKLLIDNPIKLKLADLLSGKIGTQLTAQELSKIYEEGETRYSNNTPPGYQDKKKPIPERYGDLIVWKEILKYHSQIQVPIVFVTNDKKEDWFSEEMGLTIGPRPELIDEFKKTRNDLISIYRTDQFINLTNKYLQTPINTAAVQEVTEILSERIDDSFESEYEDHNIGATNDLQLDNSVSFVNEDENESGGIENR